jgi:hypothetical protein
MAFHKKRTWLLILLPISLITLWVVRSNAWIAEYFYARGIYKWISQIISLISSLVPFSLMELEILVLPVLAFVIGIRFLLRLIKKIYKKQDGKGYMLAGGMLNLACTLSVLLFLYVNLAGVNYYRYSIAEINGLNVQQYTVKDLYALCLDLANDAASIRLKLHNQAGAEDENGVLHFSKNDWREVFNTAEESFEKASIEYPVLKGKYGSPKPVLFSKFMSRMEITGIFWPFTSEANVNIDTSDYTIPASASHELAHLRGFMREDEANFIAYLVCRQSDNLEFQYSGTMLALSYAADQLYKQDEDLYRQVMEVYNTGMVMDVREEYYYWKQFEDTVISTVSNSMNDSYLKVNNQNDGVKSYGRMVDLLLADYQENHMPK